MKKTIEEVRDWLLKNALDEDGDLYLSGLDFSKFNGDIFITSMKIKGGLYQNTIDVQGDFFSKNIKVGGKIQYEEPTKPTKMLKKITADELKEMGYELV